MKTRISRAQSKAPSGLELPLLAEVTTVSVAPSECIRFLTKNLASRARFASAPTIGLAISAPVCGSIWFHHLEHDVQLLKSDCSKILFTLICSNYGQRHRIGLFQGRTNSYHLSAWFIWLFFELHNYNDSRP